MMPGETNRSYLSKNPDLMPRREIYYARPDRRVEYQIFSSDYFSNADVKIYLGDIWIDDATSISFQVEEQIMPVYGYHSYTYDAIARGQRLVRGGFSINFKSVGYLHEVLANADAISYAIDQGEQQGIIRPEYYENMTLSEILQKLGKDSFDQIADEYERALWGETRDTDKLINYDQRPMFQQDQIGLDLRIQYGPVNETQGYISPTVYQTTRHEPPNMTVDVINGVQLTGMSKQISTADQGAPILEYYTFIARDLNGISATQLRR